MDDTSKLFDAVIACRNPDCKRKDLKLDTILRHLCHYKAQRCKNFYSSEEINAYRVQSKKLINSKKAEKQRKNYDSASRKLKHKKEYKPEKRKEEYLKKQRRDQKLSKWRIHNFRKSCKFGPIFTCVCCHGDLFYRSVRTFKKSSKLEKKLKKNGTFRKYLASIHGILDDSLSLKKAWKKAKKMRQIDESLKVFGKYHLCWSCSKHLEKGKMPPICFKNSLNYEDIPDELKLYDIEKQLIVKSLIFIKVRELPKTRMNSINDRVVNVPIEDDDIIREVTSLPRTEKNSGLVTVRLKRKLAMKTYHKKGYIRPEKIYAALVYLKNNHPEYNNIKISDCDEWLQQFCENSSSNDGNSDDSDDENSKFSNEHSSENDSNPLLDENPFTSVTCLLPEDPLCDVVGKLFLDI